MNKIRNFVLLIGFIFALANVSYAERIDTSDAVYPIPEGEIWFRVDGIGYSAIEGENECVVRAPRYTLWDAECGDYSGDIDIPSFVIEDHVEYNVVGIDAFEYSLELTSVNIPSSVRWIIGFEFCNKLENLNLPESVETIKGCSHLNSLRFLSLPSKLTSLEQACSDLDNLEVLTVNAAEPYKLGQWTFYNTPIESCMLVVPDGAKEKYMAAEKWKDFGTIIEASEMTGIDSITAVAEPSVKAITGGIEVSDYCGPVNIFITDGKQVATAIADGNTSVQLTTGLYIIRMGNHASKVIVK